MSLLPPSPLFVLRSDMRYIHSLELMFTKNNTHILAGTEDGYVYFWNLKTRKVTNKQKLGFSIRRIHNLFPYIITEEKFGQIKLWRVEKDFTCTFLNESYCKGSFCRSVIINFCLILPERNSKLESIDTKSFNTVRVYVPINEGLGNARALEKANVGGKICILAGYESGVIILFHFLSGSQLSYIQLRERITSIAFDSVTGRGVCAHYSEQVQVFKIDKEYNIKLKNEISFENTRCSVVKLRPDRKILACSCTGGWDGNLKLFSWKSLRFLVSLKQHNNFDVGDVIFSRDIVPEFNSNIMSVAAGDGSIAVFNLYNHNH